MKKIFLISLIVCAISYHGLYAQQKITGGTTINITEAPWQALLKQGSSYAWDQSSNLMPTSTSGSDAVFLANRGGTDKVGTVEVARETVSVAASNITNIPASCGCDGSYHYGRVSLGFYDPNIDLYGWQVSGSGTISQHPVGTNNVPMDIVRITGGNGSLYVRAHTSSGWSDWIYVGFLSPCSN